MSTIPATSSIRLSCVDGLIQCPICLRDLDNPRSLPCLHTFCLHCLETQWRDRSPGDRMPCPVCRTVLRVPSPGLTALPHNFFLQQLVDAKRAAVAEATAAAAMASAAEARGSSCEFCLVTEGRSTSASIYCVDCGKKLCEKCSRHRHGDTSSGNEVGGRVKTSLNRHRLKSLKTSSSAAAAGGGGGAAAAAIEECPAIHAARADNFCDKHGDRLLELYCFECKTNICLMCFIAEHRNHECHDIKQVAESLSCRMETDEQKILFQIVEVGNRRKRIDQERYRFFDELIKVEQSVHQRGNELKRLIDEHIDELLGRVHAIRADTSKSFADCLESLVSVSSAMETFYRESQEMKRKSAPHELTRTAGELHRRAKKLLTSCTKQESCYSSPSVQFIPVKIESIEQLSRDFNSVGLLHVESEVQRPAHDVIDSAVTTSPSSDVRVPAECLPTHPVSSALESSCRVNDRGDVTGVTHAEDRVYLVYSSTDLVDVFSLYPPHSRLTTVFIEGLVDPSDIVMCSTSRQLFISDNSVERCCVWKMALSAVPDFNVNARISVTAECVPIERRPWSLSITSGRLLITPYVGNRLYQHATVDGRALKQVRLSYYMEPQHAIETAQGTFVISHGSRMDACQGQISEVDDRGRVVRRFDGRVVGDMRPPLRILIDKNDGKSSIYALDAGNGKVLHLDGDLRLERSIFVRDASGGESAADAPMCGMSFSSRPGRLIIGRTNGFSAYNKTKMKSSSVRSDNKKMEQVTAELTICCSSRSVSCEV